MNRSITRYGLRFIGTSKGEEGLRLAKESRPLAIFLDVIMPEMDGWAVLARLKADPELASIPVIMTTMLDDAVAKCRAAVTAVPEVLRVTSVR